MNSFLTALFCLSEFEEGSIGLGWTPPHSPVLVCHQTARLRRLMGRGLCSGLRTNLSQGLSFRTKCGPEDPHAGR